VQRRSLLCAISMTLFGNAPRFFFLCTVGYAECNILAGEITAIFGILPLVLVRKWRWPWLNIPFRLKKFAVALGPDIRFYTVQSRFFRFPVCNG